MGELLSYLNVSRRTDWGGGLAVDACVAGLKGVIELALRFLAGTRQIPFLLTKTKMERGIQPTEDCSFLVVSCKLNPQIHKSDGDISKYGALRTGICLILTGWIKQEKEMRWKGQEKKHRFLAFFSFPCEVPGTNFQ